MIIKGQETGRRHLLATFFLLLLVTVMAGLAITHTAAADDDVEKVGSSTVKMKQFSTKQLKLKNAKASDIQWFSNNTYICVVNSSGLVQAVGGGSCKVTASYKGENYNWTIKVTPLKLNKTNLTLLQRRKGAQLKLNNKNAKNGAVWKSSHTSVATVSSKGYVTPHSAGSAVISVSWNHVTLYCNVQVMNVSAASLRKANSPKKSANRKKVIVFGSGIMDHWTDVYSAFGSTTVINNAVGLSTFADWNAWYKKLITAYKPKAVVVCLGTQDLANGMTGDDCADNMQKLIQKIHKKSKKTKIFYLSLPLFPGREDSWEDANAYNLQMKSFCGKKKYATYVKLSESLMKHGEPNPSMFRHSHTYLSADGYKMMKKLVVKKARKAARKK